MQIIGDDDAIEIGAKPPWRAVLEVERHDVAARLGGEGRKRRAIAIDGDDRKSRFEQEPRMAPAPAARSSTRPPGRIKLTKRRTHCEGAVFTCCGIGNLTVKTAKLMCSIVASVSRPRRWLTGVMILFKLKCAAEHEFEGWFRDNAAFDRQHGRHQIACPNAAIRRSKRR